MVGIPVETITLNETVIELNKGETFKLEAEVSPENADYESLSWASSDEDVATVSQEGLVTAVASGDAVISVSTGDISAECTVTVIGKPVESISFDTYSLEMEPGDTYYIITMISPGDADDKTLIWSSSDENVATVSDGTVTAIAPGSAEITASCGTAYATCYVTVNESAQPGSAQIGDFYYSDGTWSPQLDNSKTLIGIVFYVGDPAKDNVYNLNQILSEAGLATMSSSMMWSSSEVDESIKDSAFTNSATDSWCSESPKNTSLFCTYRYILAF